MRYPKKMKMAKNTFVGLVQMLFVSPFVEVNNSSPLDCPNIEIRSSMFKASDNAINRKATTIDTIVQIIFDNSVL